MTLRNFPERTLLDDFSNREGLQTFRLTKELIIMLYVRLQIFLETTTQRSHVIPGMTKLLAVLHFLGKASYHMVAGDVVGVSQASFSHVM